MTATHVGESFPHLDPEIPLDWQERLAEDYPEIADAIAPTQELLAKSIEKVRTDKAYRSSNLILNQIDLYNVKSQDYRRHPYYQAFLFDEHHRNRINEVFVFSDAQRRFELSQAFRESGTELSREGTDYRADPLMPLKMLIALRLIRPTSGDDISGFTSVPSLSQVATDLETTAESMSVADSSVLHGRTIKLMSGLVDFVGITEQPYLTNARKLIGGFGTLLRNRGSGSFLPSSYKDMPGLSAALRRVELYGPDSTEPDEIINELERLISAQRFNSGYAKRLESRALEMILGTIDVLGKDMGSDNAKKMHEVLVNNKTRVRPELPGTVITLDSFIQLANGLVGSINNSRKSDGASLEKLTPSIRSLPEAFRRIMFVALDGNEDDPRASQLELTKRFTAADLLVDIMERQLERKRKVGRVATNGRSRGELPKKGQTFWRRWQPGYGSIT